MDTLALLYPFTKSIHILAVISWMAGMLYLPRLFVNHSEQREDANTVAVFEGMEERLLRIIMRPAMFVTWGFGLLLVITPGIVNFAAIWIWVKLLAVIAMTGVHGWLGAERKRILAGQIRPSRTYRIINEIPTLLMIVIVFAVVFKF